MFSKRLTIALYSSALAMIIAYAGYRAIGICRITSQIDSNKSTQRTDETSQQCISSGFGSNADHFHTDQVMISCVFGELTLHNSQNNILDWFQNLDENKHGTLARNKGGLLPVSENVFSTEKDSQNAGVGDSFLVYYGRVGENQTDYLESLIATGEFNVISRPTVFTTHHQKAVISCGQQIAIPWTGYSEPPASASIADYEFREGPFSLEVVALVNSSDELTLDITISKGKDHAIPNNLTRVIIPNNQGVLLGGLFLENTTTGFNAAPIAGKSAIATKLFSSRTKNSTCKEMIILIHPRIIRHNTK